MNTQDLSRLEIFLYEQSGAFEVNAHVLDLARFLDRRMRERRQTAYGMDREGMGAAAMVLNAQAKGLEDALDELLRLMQDDTSDGMAEVVGIFVPDSVEAQRAS